jgi:uncharacterized protein (TIGR00725 family)
MKRLISIIGGATCNEDEAQFASTIGRELSEKGYGILCGGRGGVMEAACRGASEVGGLSIGLLPGPDLKGANPYLTFGLPTGLNEARNVLVILGGEVVVAIGGGHGTLSEIAHAVRAGKEVVGYQTWEASRDKDDELQIHRVESPEEALRQIDSFLER